MFPKNVFKFYKKSKQIYLKRFIYDVVIRFSFFVILIFIIPIKTKYMMLKLKIKVIFLLFATVILTNCTQSENNYESGAEELFQSEERGEVNKAIRIIHDDEDIPENETADTDDADLEDVPSTNGLKQIATATGDLDKDKIPEKVVVFDTKRESESGMGTEREIHIYKKKNGDWKLWNKSIGAVLPSENGGMMGDPFESLAIERGSIVIKHFGGSRQKWNYTHRFRYQNNGWELIGATVIYGSPCDYWENFDYNLSTGKYIYSKETEDCEGAKTKTKKTTKEGQNKLARLPKMDSFEPGNTEFDVSGGTEMYY
jgi:hypothetical protein